MFIIYIYLLNFNVSNNFIQDVTDNEISGSKKSGMTLEKRKDLNLDLKTKNKDIKSGYFRLEGMFSEVGCSKHSNYGDFFMYFSYFSLILSIIIFTTTILLLLS